MRARLWKMMMMMMIVYCKQTPKNLYQSSQAPDIYGDGDGWNRCAYGSRSVEVLHIWGEIIQLILSFALSRDPNGCRIHRGDPIVHDIYLRWRGCRTNCRVNQRIVSFPSRNAASSEVSSCVRCLISTKKGGRGRCRPSLFRASIRHDLSAVADLGRAPRASLWPAGPDACSSFKLPTVAFESTLDVASFSVVGHRLRRDMSLI